MMGQIIDGIVRGTHGMNAELFQDAMGRKLVRFQFLVGALPNLLGVLFIDQQVDVEIAQ